MEACHQMVERVPTVLCCSRFSKRSPVLWILALTIVDAALLEEVCRFCHVAWDSVLWHLKHLSMAIYVCFGNKLGLKLALSSRWIFLFYVNIYTFCSCYFFLMLTGSTLMTNSAWSCFCSFMEQIFIVASPVTPSSVCLLVHWGVLLWSRSTLFPQVSKAHSFSGLMVLVHSPERVWLAQNLILTFSIQSDFLYSR